MGGEWPWVMVAAVDACPLAFWGWRFLVCILVFPTIGRKPPKWMVYNGSNPIKMEDFGGIYTPYFWFNTYVSFLEPGGSDKFQEVSSS